MKALTVSSNFYTVVTVACTLAALVYLFATQPAIAPIFMAAALPFVVGIIAQLQQAKQIDSKVDGVHEIVNSQRTAMEAKIEAQDARLRDLTAALTRVEQTLTQERADKETLIAAALATPADGTPAHGTPIRSGGATVVEAPVLVVAPKIKKPTG